MFHKSQKSFTLIELLVVIAIVGLVTTITVVALSGAQAKARDAKRKAEVDSIRKALALYYSDEGKYPTSTDWISLENPTSTEAQRIRDELKEWLPTTPEDPLYGQLKDNDPTKPFSYQYKTNDTATEYKIHVEMESGTYATYETYSSGGGGIVYEGEGGTACDIVIHDCATLDQAGKTYCLDQDIIDSASSSCINITADNITFDGQGHTIDGNDVASYGIYLYRGVAATTSVTIKNCTVSDWNNANAYSYQANGNSFDNIALLSSPVNGIYLYHSGSNTLTNVTSTSNSTGIRLFYSNSNNFSNVTSNSNSTGIYLNASFSNTLTNITSNSNGNGVLIDLSSGNAISNSAFTDNPRSDFYVSSDNSSNCNNSLTNVVGTGDKPILYTASPITLTNSNNEYSEILLCDADGSILTNVTLDHTGLTQNNGLYLVRTDNATLKNINVINLQEGIWLDASRSNTLINITSTSNIIGIELNSSNENTLEDSHIENNSAYGIYLNSAGESEPNTIYNNVFNNDTNFYFYSAGTIYNNNWSTSTTSTGSNIIGGLYIGGNYWSDYDESSEGCDDSNADGICDTPYDLLGDGTNVDYYPLKP